MTIYSKIDCENALKIVEEYNGELIECVEGCLIDNYLYSSNIGYIALYEIYLNEWTSGYKMILPNSKRESNEIENEFYNFYRKEQI